MADQLPPDYVERFGHPDGVDGNFFRFFGVTHEQMMDGLTCHPTDADFVAWFTALPGIDPDRIAAWNAFAEKLGQPGYPMAERLAEVLSKRSARFETSKTHSIFDLIAFDESHP